MKTAAHAEIELAESPTGTQSVERAVQLLQAIARRGDAGARLTDLVTELGLSKPTARRLLAALIEENILAQNSETRRYYLGLELFSLGALAGQRLDLRRVSIDALVRLTDETQDTVFLSMPDGRDSICIARHEGQYPIRALTMSVGDRRPLGVGAGSLAILSGLSDAEVAETLRANAPRYLPYAPEISPARLREKVAATRLAGFASSTFFMANGKVMPGMNAIGVPIVTRLGVTIGAVSVAAVPQRLDAKRRSQVVGFAQRAAQAIAQAAATA
jgi:DNA-binding IclR family transcriptional regulator